jgi:FkbM family methyltransferase
VTKIFYHRGWSGINIEANPEKYGKFLKNRPRDINLNVAIGKKSEFSKFYIMTSSAMSTLDKCLADSMVQSGSAQIKRVVEIAVTPLREIIDSYADSPIDLLNIDIEGMDLDAVESLDFPTLPAQKWPKWISVENVMPLKNTLQMGSVTFLQQFGYGINCVLPHVTILKSPFVEVSPK